MRWMLAILYPPAMLWEILNSVEKTNKNETPFIYYIISGAFLYFLYMLVF